MTAVIRLLIDEWVIPRMNAKTIRTNVFVGNVASQRVFEKNGFRFVETLHDWLPVSESRGGGKTSIHILEWTRPDKPRIGV